MSLTRRATANLVALLVFVGTVACLCAVAYVLWHAFPTVFDWLYTNNEPDSPILNGDT